METDTPSPSSLITQQTKRPALSLDLKSIDEPSACPAATPGPSTAAILKKIEIVAPDLKEIFPHINDCNGSSDTDALCSDLNSPGSTAIIGPSMDNLFDECFKNASARRLRLNVPTCSTNKDQSLQTPALNIVSPMKGPNLFVPRAPEIDPSSSNCDNGSEKEAGAPPRKRGRPPKVVKQLLPEDNETVDENELKKARDKERNRLAALAFRQNRKDWVREISTRVRLLEDQNATLQAQLGTAQKKIAHLENEMMLLARSSDSKSSYKCLIPPPLLPAITDKVPLNR